MLIFQIFDNFHVVYLSICYFYLAFIVDHIFTIFSSCFSLLSIFLLLEFCNRIVIMLFIFCSFLPSCRVMVCLLLFFLRFVCGILLLVIEDVFEVYTIGCGLEWRICELFLDFIINLVILLVSSASILYSKYYFIEFIQASTLTLLFILK